MDIAGIGLRHCAVGHDEVAAGLQVKRFAGSAGAEVGVLVQVTPGAEAAVARAVADRRAQREVGSHAARLQQQVAVGFYRAAGQGRQAACRGGQNKVAVRG